MIWGYHHLRKHPYVSFLRCRVGRKKGETHLQFRSGTRYTTMSVDKKKTGEGIQPNPPWRILWVWYINLQWIVMNGWFFMVPYSRSGLEVICAVWVILVPSDLAIKFNQMLEVPKTPSHWTQQNFSSFDSDRSPKPIERPVCTWKANGNSRRFLPHQSGKFDPRSSSENHAPH